MKICARVKKLREGGGDDGTFQPSLPVYLTNFPLVAAKILALRKPQASIAQTLICKTHLLCRVLKKFGTTTLSFKLKETKKLRLSILLYYGFTVSFDETLFVLVYLTKF